MQVFFRKMEQAEERLQKAEVAALNATFRVDHAKAQLEHFRDMQRILAALPADLQNNPSLWIILDHMSRTLKP
jgi:hypothetical protein